jgi:hypothetical protein
MATKRMEATVIGNAVVCPLCSAEVTFHVEGGEHFIADHCNPDGEPCPDSESAFTPFDPAAE